MTEPLSLALVYAVPIVAFVGLYGGFRVRTTRRSRARRDEAVAGGRTEPPSLHPLIDRTRCIGCGSCVLACPENMVLGVISGKAELVDPTRCIGHGVCETACPTRAITLVFGTERRGVDIPRVKPDFETNVPGVFIAGELGGMGLIRNAVEQGRQAIDSISKLSGMGRSEVDVVIVGAGPAGLAASLAAKQKRLSYITIEQDSLGGTVAHYPRGKIVMTAPMKLPLVGKVRFTTTTKEELLELWQQAEGEYNLDIRYGETVTGLSSQPHGIHVSTNRDEYDARAVLLAIGRRGTPRKLGVPGEESSKVVYRLIDPEQYSGSRVLVVGGGDSAIEAAVALADSSAETVTLAYRGEAITRAKQENLERLRRAQKSGHLRLLLKSEVARVEENAVLICVDGETMELANDAIIVCAGGILPRAFLEKAGIEVETKHGTR